MYMIAASCSVASVAQSMSEACHSAAVIQNVVAVLTMYVGLGDRCKTSYTLAIHSNIDGRPADL